MMTGIIAKAWKTVKPHVPLIKFRKGGTSRGHPGADVAASGSEAGKSGTPKIQTTSRPVIEDWQLPPRYRRQMLDEKEIDMINSGGAY